MMQDFIPLERTLKVLVADDSAAIRLAFKRAAETSPQRLEVFEVSTGDEFLAKFRSKLFDLAFVDVNMPGMSGPEALAHCRAEGVKTFAVIMSGRTSPEMITIAKQLKAYDFLTKPFGTLDIATIIKNYVRLQRRMSVLIVDDSATVRKVVAKVLDACLFDVTYQEAGSGTEALQMFTAMPPDVVFLDVNMPGIDGISTLKKMKKAAPGSRIILMSGDRSEDKMNEATEAGADVFLPKPFYQKDVDALLFRLFGLHPPYLASAA